MTIRAHLWSATYATVHTAPNWFERLLGHVTRDEAVVWVQGVGWCSDATGRQVQDARVIAEIERCVPVMFS